MPHFVIDCSEDIFDLQSPYTLMQSVYDSASATGLFSEGDIKIRINHFQFYNVGNTKNDFIHIFGNIMEGRTSIQKSELSTRIISNLKTIFPDVPIISINIRDFEQATYCNKSMV